MKLRNVLRMLWVGDMHEASPYNEHKLIFILSHEVTLASDFNEHEICRRPTDWKEVIDRMNTNIFFEGRCARNRKNLKQNLNKNYLGHHIILHNSSITWWNKKTLLYKKLLYHLFVCLMAWGLRLGKKNMKRWRSGKRPKGLRKKKKNQIPTVATGPLACAKMS